MQALHPGDGTGEALTSSSAPSLPERAELEVRLLGPLAILVDGLPVPAARAAARLLAALALHPDAPLERDWLAHLFWPDSPQGQARTNLRGALHNLRRWLPALDDRLDVHAPALRWLPGREPEVDAVRFRAAIATGTLRPLQRAVESYRGELLQGWQDEWLQAERAELRQLWLSALQRLADLEEASGAHAAAARLAERLRAEDPLNEEHVRRLMRLRALLGDRAGVQAAFRAATILLQRELDVAPSTATVALYR